MVGLAAYSFEFAQICVLLIDRFDLFASIGSYWFQNSVACNYGNDRSLGGCFRKQKRAVYACRASGIRSGGGIRFP